MEGGFEFCFFFILFFFNIVNASYLAKFLMSKVGGHMSNSHHFDFGHLLVWFFELEFLDLGFLLLLPWY